MANLIVYFSRTGIDGRYELCSLIFVYQKNFKVFEETLSF